MTNLLMELKRIKSSKLMNRAVMQRRWRLF